MAIRSRQLIRLTPLMLGSAPGIWCATRLFARFFGSGRDEHRHWRAAFARLEDEADGLADPDRVEVAIDDVGHHRGALGERHIGDRIGDRRPPHHAIGIDRAFPRRFDPFGLVAEAERAMGARVEMRLAAGGAFLDQELAVGRGIPEMLGLEVDRRRGNLAFGHRPYSLSMITVAAACRVPSDPPVPCASAISRFLTCTAGCASPRSWRTASSTLVSPPRFEGWLLQRPPPSVLNGNLPTPEIRLPSLTKRPPWPFSQNPRSSSCIKTVIVKLS